MTVFIMVSMKYGLLRESIDGYDSDLYFVVYVFSVLCLMAFGYLINDYYDVETDKINKPGKNIFADAPAQRIWVLSSILIFFSLLPWIILITCHVGDLISAFLNVVALVLLFIYAKAGKATVLWGNLHIAFLGALLLVATFFASGEFYFHNEFNFRLLLMYSTFSFLTTLLREIVKDAEDVEGDTRSGILTLAGKYGTRASRYVGYFVNIALVLALTYIAHSEYQIQQYNRAIGFGILAVYGIFTLFILWYSRDKAGFRRTSQALKIYMVLGITSMWL